MKSVLSEEYMTPTMKRGIQEMEDKGMWNCDTCGTIHILPDTTHLMAMVHQSPGLIKEFAAKLGIKPEVLTEILLKGE